jgi:hypothetical protein
VKTDFQNCLFNHGPLLRIKRHWLMPQLASLGSLEPWFMDNARCSVNILFAIHRAAWVAMQPRAITAKCDEVGQRELIVVKVSHG